MTRRSLLFYTHALVGGGAERVIARLASGFAARGDRVTLAVDFEAQNPCPISRKKSCCACCRAATPKRRPASRD